MWTVDDSPVRYAATLASPPRKGRLIRCRGNGSAEPRAVASAGAWRTAAAVAVFAIVVGPYAGIIAGLVTLPAAIALDWETRRRREAATRSKATEGD
jgi:hypothetical protein